METENQVKGSADEINVMENEDVEVEALVIVWVGCAFVTATSPSLFEGVFLLRCLLLLIIHLVPHFLDQ